MIEVNEKVHSFQKGLYMIIRTCNENPEEIFQVKKHL